MICISVYVYLQIVSVSINKIYIHDSCRNMHTLRNIFFKTNSNAHKLVVNYLSNSVAHTCCDIKIKYEFLSSSFHYCTLDNSINCKYLLSTSKLPFSISFSFYIMRRFFVLPEIPSTFFFSIFLHLRKRTCGRDAFFDSPSLPCR